MISHDIYDTCMRKNQRVYEILRGFTRVYEHTRLEGFSAFIFAPFLSRIVTY